MKHVGHGLGGRRINLHAAMEQESDRNVLSIRRPVMQKSRGNHRDMGHWDTPRSFHGKLKIFPSFQSIRIYEILLKYMYSDF